MDNGRLTKRKTSLTNSGAENKCVSEVKITTRTPEKNRKVKGKESTNRYYHIMVVEDSRFVA